MNRHQASLEALPAEMSNDGDVDSHAIRRSVEFTQSWLEFLTRRRETTGLVVNVRLGDQEVLSQAFGHADVDASVPLSVEHLFNIGSQSKMLTALAVAQLIASDESSLQDRAVHHLPWLHEHRDRRFDLITISDLLQHTSGLVRDGHRADFWQMLEPFPDERQLRDLALTSDLVFHPGARFKYSNLGFALLGMIIEAVSGTPYDQYIHKAVAEPLQLSSLVQSDPALGERAARSYLRNDDGSRPSYEPPAVRAFTPATGWCATAGDMTSLLVSQSRDRQTGQWGDLFETVVPRHGPWRALAARGADYGSGVMAHDIGGSQLLGHSGGLLGHRSCTFVEPTTGLAVAVMANATDVPIVELAFGVFGVFRYFARYGDHGSPERKRLNVRLANAWETMEVVATAERIVSVAPESWRPFSSVNEELEQVSPRELRITRSDELHYAGEKVLYHFDDMGGVDRVVYAGATVRPTQ